MKTLFFLLLVSISCATYGQETDSNKYVYSLIVGTERLMSSKVTVEVDFGQGQSYWNPNKNKIKDADGKPIVFNSMVDALNYMANDGWEFVQAYAISVGNQNVFHYLMRLPQEKAKTLFNKP